MVQTHTVSAVLLMAAIAGAIGPLEGDLFIETTMLVPKAALKSAILMHPANFTKKKGAVLSSYGVYGGYIAKVGDAINITCNDSRLAVERTFVDPNTTTQVVNEPNRVIVRRESSVIKVNILSASSNDSGRYSCGYDAKYLTIIEPSNPPRALNHQCVSHSFDDLVCEFQTNSDKNDLVDWDIRYSVREERLCNDYEPCKNQKCTSNWIEKSTDGVSGDKVFCKIESWLFTELQYYLTVNATNPYATSSFIFNATLDTSIVSLAKPQVRQLHAANNRVAIYIQLNEKNMASKALYGANGFIENAIFMYGVTYQVTVSSEALRDTEYAATVPRVHTFSYKNTTSWITVGDLLPHTKYTFNIITQMNNTINEDVWSEPTSFSIRTKETRPDAAPKCSSHGFTISRSSTCADGRMVTLFWQRLPVTPGKGNGITTSYKVYSNNQSPLKIDGDSNYAEICAGTEAVEISVQPGNSAGYGSQMAQYFVPREDRTLDVRPCDIQVVYNTSGDTLTVTWPSLPQEYRVTVFWCKLDVGLNCQNKELQWSEVEVNQTLFQILRWRETASKTVGSYGYKFGVSAHTSAYTSSGIVWAHCIDHVEKDLEPAETEVHYNGLEATVTVVDRCHLGSRLAKSYTVNYCRYDREKAACATLEKNGKLDKEASQVQIDSCNKSATVLVHKYGTDYAFWVISHADTLSVKSEIVVKKTDRKALTWEIAVPVVLSLLFVVALTLCLVYFNGQRKQVQQFKRPQLVLATTTMIETDDMSDCQEESSAEQSSFTPYLTADKPLMPIFKDERNYPGALVPSDYQNKSQFDSHDSDSLDNSYFFKYDGTRPSTLSYQKPVLNASGGNYKNTSAMTSCGRLPDDYLQCTKAEPELSMSAQWFLGDDSNSTFIDLNKFLVDTETPSPAKSVQEVELPPTVTMPDHAVVIETSASNESNNNRVASDRVLTKKQSLSSGNLSELSTDNNNYHRITDYISQPSNLQETPFTDTHPHSPESSSGDSGYVGRNALLNLAPPPSSIPQS